MTVRSAFYIDQLSFQMAGPNDDFANGWQNQLEVNCYPFTSSGAFFYPINHPTTWTFTYQVTAQADSGGNLTVYYRISRPSGFEDTGGAVYSFSSGIAQTITNVFTKAISPDITNATSISLRLTWDGPGTITGFASNGARPTGQTWWLIESPGGCPPTPPPVPGIAKYPVDASTTQEWFSGTRT